MDTRLSMIKNVDTVDTLSKAQIIRDLNEWFFVYEGLPVKLTRKAAQMDVESLKRAWRFAWYVCNWDYANHHGQYSTANDDKQSDIRECYNALQCGYYEKWNE